MLTLFSVHAASPFSSAISSVTSHSLTCVPSCHSKFSLGSCHHKSHPWGGVCIFWVCTPEGSEILGHLRILLTTAHNSVPTIPSFKFYIFEIKHLPKLTPCFNFTTEGNEAMVETVSFPPVSEFFFFYRNRIHFYHRDIVEFLAGYKAT